MRGGSRGPASTSRAIPVACLMACWAWAAALGQSARADQSGARFEPGQATGRMGPYLGETPPGVTPRVFAPGVISRPETREYAASLSPDGREFYFTRTGDRQVIMVSRLGPQGWTFPEPVTFSAGFSAHEPHVTYDNRLVFWGWFRPPPQGETSRARDYGIYMAERTPTGWSEARFVGDGMAVSSTRDGRLYVTDYGAGGGYLVEVTLVNGRFGERQRLRGGMDALRPTLTTNTAHPALAPDGSYIVFDIGGGPHLFVCFRNADGTWGEAIDLTRHGIPPEGGIASVSPDGQYLFFRDGGDIYWVSTTLIESLRPGARTAPRAPGAAASPMPAAAGAAPPTAPGGRTALRRPSNPHAPVTR